MDNKNIINKFKYSEFKKILFILIIALGLISWIYFAVNIFMVTNHKSLLLRQYYREPVVVTDISSWMTFDYLNKIFHLPPFFFKQQFRISDKRYPKITIKQYAKIIGTNSADLTKKVQNSIKTFLASSTIQ